VIRRSRSPSLCLDEYVATLGRQTRKDIVAWLAGDAPRRCVAVDVIVDVDVIGPVIVAVNLNVNEPVGVIDPVDGRSHGAPGSDHDQGIVPVHVHVDDHGCDHGAVNVNDHGHGVPDVC
jgi:hypothetical protein